MSVGEIFYRIHVRLAISIQKQKHKNALLNQPPKPETTVSVNWIKPLPTIINKQEYIEAANKIIDGHLTVFQLDTDAYSIVRNWNRDPKTGTIAPLLFGKTLDYRDLNLVGDIKYLWEPNRHLHLIALSQAFHLSNEGVYLKAIKLHVQSWIDQCPYLLGPNWSSSLEVAIRLINWSIVWQFIGGNTSILFEGADGETFKDNWIASIFQHMEFISGNFSRYSSANNHLIGEAAGLFIASNTWPFWKEKTIQWKNISHKILLEEAIRQTYPDGVTREQAISYQQFVLDFLILSYFAGKSETLVFPEVYLRRIEKMMEFIASIMDTNGNMTMIGDADDGYVVRMSQEPDFCPYKSLLAIGSYLFQRQDFFQRAGKLDDKTRWLLGNSNFTIKKGFENPYTVTNSFPSGGYYILGRDYGTPKEIRCLVDCGPLGYLSIAAHGHADALAINLSVGGKEFLIDTGTFCYHTQPEWREYFRGTAAHNTIRIDHRNQSESGGNFMWTQKARCFQTTFEVSAVIDRFEGWHDGYKRLTDPVIHRREIIFKKNENILSIIDTIECSRRHIVERFWHFHENCEIEIQEQTITAQHDGFLIIMSAKENESRIFKYKGNEELPSGWVSRFYDCKTPTVSIVMENVITQTTQLQTDISIPL